MRILNVNDCWFGCRGGRKGPPQRHGDHREKMNPTRRTEGLIAVLEGCGWLVLLACCGPAALGDTGYYRHSFFDNSLTRDAYYYSSGKVSAPSALALAGGGKLPVETKIFFTPPNALRLEGTSP